MQLSTHSARNSPLCPPTVKEHKLFVCKDGIVESFKTEKLNFGQGNTVIMKAFLESIDSDVLGDMLEMMECRIPHVALTYNRKNR